MFWTGSCKAADDSACTKQAACSLSITSSIMTCHTVLPFTMLPLPILSKLCTGSTQTSPNSLCTPADMPTIPDAPAPTSGAEVSEHAQLAWLHELALYLDPALSLPELAQSGRTVSELPGRTLAEASAGSGDGDGPALSASACFQALLVHATPAAAKVGPFMLVTELRRCRFRLLCHVATREVCAWLQVSTLALFGARLMLWQLLTWHFAEVSVPTATQDCSCC